MNETKPKKKHFSASAQEVDILGTLWKPSVVSITPSLGIQQHQPLHTDGSFIWETQHIDCFDIKLTKHIRF